VVHEARYFARHTGHGAEVGGDGAGDVEQVVVAGAVQPHPEVVLGAGHAVEVGKLAEVGRGRRGGQFAPERRGEADDDVDAASGNARLAEWGESSEHC